LCVLAGVDPRDCTVAARATKIYMTKQGSEFNSFEIPGATSKKTREASF
jgi:hypothetical protein